MLSVNGLLIVVNKNTIAFIAMLSLFSLRVIAIVLHSSAI
jgi:hypothetical protein